MIPEKSTQPQQPGAVQQDSILLVGAFVIILPLLIGLAIILRKKHQRKVLKAQVEFLEKTWRRKSNKRYF